MPFEDFMEKVPLVQAKMARRDARMADWQQLQAQQGKEEYSGGGLEAWLRLRARQKDERIRERDIARDLYEDVNGHLMVELPALYRARLYFISK